MGHYPESDWVTHPDEVKPDGSVMVSSSVTIEEKTRNMFLPVMDNYNKAVQNPTAREISDTRMRCLVKNIALFGLGFYIYAGEDLPTDEPSPTNQPSTEAATDKQLAAIEKMIDGKEVPEQLHSEITGWLIGTPDKATASRYIGLLGDLPRRPAVTK